MKLTDHVALASGGSARIGAYAARLFVWKGAQVVMSGRNVECGERAATDIADGKGHMLFIPADLGDPDTVDNLAEQARDIWILVNNAASLPTGRMVDPNATSLQNRLDTNVRGSFLLTATPTPGMLAWGWGRIVNVSTMAASIGVAGAAGYSASKAAIESLTRTWGTEFGPGPISARVTRGAARVTGPAYGRLS